MKKFFTLLVLAACCAAMTWGCSDDKYDDTEIRQEIENLKQEIASMKEQVNSLKTIIDALNENKFITNYTEAADGGGDCAAPKRRRRPPEETNVRSGERLKRSPAKAG